MDEIMDTTATSSMAFLPFSICFSSRVLIRLVNSELAANSTRSVS